MVVLAATKTADVVNAGRGESGDCGWVTGAAVAVAVVVVVTI